MDPVAKFSSILADIRAVAIARSTSNLKCSNCRAHKNFGGSVVRKTDSFPIF